MVMDRHSVILFSIYAFFWLCTLTQPTTPALQSQTICLIIKQKYVQILITDSALIYLKTNNQCQFLSTPSLSAQERSLFLLSFPYRLNKTQVHIIVSRCLLNSSRAATGMCITSAAAKSGSEKASSLRLQVLLSSLVW